MAKKKPKKKAKKRVATTTAKKTVATRTSVRKPSKETAMARATSRTDLSRTEQGARIHNKHITGSTEGSGSSTSDVPAFIVVSVPLDPVTVGLTLQLHAVVENAAGTVLSGSNPDSWSSSNAAVATVDGNGLVTGIAAGSVAITAHLGGISSTAVPVSVVAAPDLVAASVTVSPTSLSIASGTSQLTAVIKNAGGDVLSLTPTSWTSADHAVCTVDSSGLVTFVGVGGPTNVQAHYNAIASNACAVTGAASGNPSSVILAMDFETMTATGPANFTGSPNGQTLTDAYASGQIDIISDPTARATGKVARFAYGGDGSGGSDDKFLGFYGVPTQPYGAHLWARGKIHIPTGTGAWSTSDNRKLIRINNSFASGLNGQDVVLHRVDANNLRYVSQQFVNGGQGPGGDLFGYTGADIANDTWVTIEVHLRMSSAKDALDGLLEVYINDAGSATLSIPSAMDFATAGVTTNAGQPIVVWGDQLTVPFGHTGYSEYRYWDDLEIATTRIGA